jgi:hypothetical protein
MNHLTWLTTTTIVDTTSFAQYPTTTIVHRGMDDFVLGDRELDVMGVLWAALPTQLVQMPFSFTPTRQ